MPAKYLNDVAHVAYIKIINKTVLRNSMLLEKLLGMEHITLKNDNKKFPLSSFFSLVRFISKIFPITSNFLA